MAHAQRRQPGAEQGRERQPVGQGWRSLGAVTALLLLPLQAGALGTGDLDTSFGGTGKVITDFSSGSADRAYAMAVQTDGKMVVVGTSNGDFAVARYQTNGTLDSSFSGDGKVTANFSSGSDDTATAVAIQADGKIVVAGTSINTSGRHAFALARFTPTGALDTSFHSDGKLLTNFTGSSNDSASAMAIQTNGKIVVAGVSEANGLGDFALARYNTNGSLDTSFSGDGKVTTDFPPVFGPNSDDRAYALVLQPDGKLVVAGAASGQYNHDFGLARYTSTGALDTTFGNNGLVTTHFYTGEDCECDPYHWISALALQADGKIVAAGTVSASSVGDWFGLARYNPNGTLDPSFSGDGKVTTYLVDGYAEASALALQVDSKIVVAGYLYDEDGGGSSSFVLVRYNPNGALDPSFSGDGKVTTDVGGDAYAFAYALAIQPRDGRIVVTGSAGGDFALARYHAHTCNGLVVTQIGTNGDDVLMGTSGNDVIYAFGGNDLVDGLGGDDIICGGAGNDTLRGGSGNDFLRGDTGTDTCDGGTGSGDTAVCETVTNVP